MRSCRLFLLGLLSTQGYQPRRQPCPRLPVADRSDRIDMMRRNQLGGHAPPLAELTCTGRSTRLYSSNEANPNRNPFRRLPNPLKTLKATTTKLANSWSRFRARFQALPTKAKRIVIVQMIALLFLFGGLTGRVIAKNSPPRPTEVSYSGFLRLVDEAADEKSPRIDQLVIGTDRISFRLYHSSDRAEIGQDRSLMQIEPGGTKRAVRSKQQLSYLPAYTRKVSASPELVKQLRTNDISFMASGTSNASAATLALRSCFIAFYAMFLFRLYKIMSNNMSGKGDAPGKLAVSRDVPRVSFDEIQGIDNAKLEVMELVDVLRNPDKYAILGARAPTGLLLCGPPGTGKTMLAKATAATAGVPLVYCSGSDFVEMFVGRGAARVRQLFERAQKLAPCIIFIDELDALGKSRDFGGNGMFQRSNDEAEQTLNQLLACMDGLDSRRQVCVLAATNRKDVLDPALTRPGRLDRIVQLELPNAAGREQILRVHTSKLPGFVEGTGLDADRLNPLGKGRKVDLSAIAAVTDGLSGAELEFLVNEAAIRAVRRVSSAIQQGTAVENIVPHVEAQDFEESLRSYFETRSKGTPSVNDFIKKVWKA